MMLVVEESRTYRGRIADRRGTGWFENVVEVVQGAPTWSERHSSITLRELSVDFDRYPGDLFSWGWSGGGSLATSHAILRDALGRDPQLDLRRGFRDDVLVQLPLDDWMLNWKVVDCWARGWAGRQEAALVGVQE